MNKQMLEFLNAKIFEYMSVEKLYDSQIIRIVHIAKLLRPYIKEDIKDYTKKQTYEYLKENFPILDCFNSANKQLLVEVLKG